MSNTARQSHLVAPPREGESEFDDSTLPEIQPWEGPASEETDSESQFDFWRESKRVRQERGERNRRTADHEFEDARELARRHGMTLIMRCESHYQLRKPREWLQNIYPGNRRLYYDRNQRHKPPYVKLPENWGIIDVVKAYIHY